MYHNFDPLDPMDPYTTDPLPSSDNPEQDLIAGYLGSIVSLLVFFLVSFFISCGTTRETSYVERHRMESIMDRMDSLLRVRTVVQQDSVWRETILRQFQSIRERSDTSHTVVVDTAGKVIKETLIINNVRETTSESDRLEREMLMHRLDVQDSTINLMRQQILHSDSLLQQRQETTVKEVAKPLTWWQQSRIWLGNIVVVALAVAAGWWVIRKKAWWLRLLRKIL